MGHRLSKIYTRTGDDGSTGLAGNIRLSKDHPRIHAIGDIDELNCQLGIVLCHIKDAPLTDLFQSIQQTLFDFGGELAMPEYQGLNDDHIETLEQHIDQLNNTLPPLKEFILPGGNTASAHCHLARAVCRRAERKLITLNNTDSLRPTLITYINRLSDLLFVVARVLSRTTSPEEPQWHPAAKPDH